MRQFRAAGYLRVRIDDRPDHLPIGLAEQVVLRHRVEPGQVLTFADVELPPSRALDAWHAILRQRAERVRGLSAVVAT
jgi:predicted homoserine dehydrogenase-like protein